jgi:hypothetical protein
MPLEDRDASRLRDMLLWSRKAIFILGSATYEAMMANEEKRLALVRCLEVIGEAGHDVSPPVKALLPSFRGLPCTACEIASYMTMATRITPLSSMLCTMNCLALHRRLPTSSPRKVEPSKAA